MSTGLRGHDVPGSPAWSARSLVEGRPDPGAPGVPPGSTRGSVVGLVVAIASIVALSIVLHAGALLIVIASLVVIVMVHELGHFATAKWSHMKVTEYFVGFGPRLWSVRRGETEYGVKAIPAGGYVKIPGMTNLEEIDPADEARTYRRQPFHNRLLVASAGSIMHFVMAFLLAWSALAFIGTPSATGVVIESFTPFSGLAQNPAQRGGLQAGDQVVSVDGHAVKTTTAFGNDIKRAIGRPVHLVVDRGGRRLSLTVTPVNGQTVTSDGQRLSKARRGYIGVILGSPSVTENPFGALGGAGKVVGEVTSSSVTGLAHLFSPHGISSYVSQVTNPAVAARDQRNGTNRPVSIVGAARIAVAGVHAGALQLIEVLIALNVFIGLFNMLPILPLDGGHVAIALYERVRTRRGRPYYQADAAKLLVVAYVFIFLLVLLVSSSVYLDITHPVQNPFG
ncbi:MAG TPA: site-2 protease family protein [Acidimicrobiales bacterium]|nr:site-2 protease family protein [Acidimicrobiales bacterium]